MNKIKEEALERETNASKNKSKGKRPKINKEETEQKILEGFEFDCKIIFDVRKNCSLDVTTQKCRKCTRGHQKGLRLIFYSHRFSNSNLF